MGQWHILRSYCFVAEVTFKKTTEIEKLDDTKILLDTDNKLRDDITFANVQ